MVICLDIQQHTVWNISIDIGNVYRYLKSLINFLDGCDSMLDEIAEYESDMRTEYEAEMSSYMVW